MSVYRVFVANSLKDTVSACDISSTGQKKVVAVIPVGKYPRCIALTRDQARAAVTNYNSASVSIINTTTNKVIWEITGIPKPTGIAFGETQQWKRFYVGSFLEGRVHVINAQKYQNVVQIPVGDGPAWVTISPDSQFVYVTNFYANTMSVIDTKLNAVVNTVKIDFNPNQVVATKSGKVYLVPQQMDVNFAWVIQVFDPANMTVNDIELDGTILLAIAANPEGTTVYVTEFSWGIGYVAAVDTKSDNVAAVLQIGVWPKGAAFSRDGAYCFISDFSLDQLIVVNTQNFSVFQTLNLGAGAGPYGVASRQLK